ncbi:MAG: alpha-glucan family phosphorylase [Methanotrichaceae archaeon]|nr:alpha-glucan family phosphorylase [Methanotrichaceae archaeon]
MEIGIRSDIPTYSGGLGALAGDSVRSCADLKIPLVAVTLVSRKGYLRQQITEWGDQIDHPDDWEPSKFMRLLPEAVTVRIEGRDVKIKSWLYDFQSPTGGLVPVCFLDTYLTENDPEDRDITSVHYGGDERYRLKQEIVLGIGGFRMLNALKFKINKYHMNEGHSSLLTLELLKKTNLDADRTRDLSIFTTHTPVEAAFDKFSYDDVHNILGEDSVLAELKKYAGQDRLNTTLLALNLSKYVNGVTKAHMDYSKHLFPGYHLKAVTNGIHPCTWTSQPFRELFDAHIPGWANEPELLVRVDEIPYQQIWDAHIKAKTLLIDYINKTIDADMGANVLTLGFARRAAAYKRATFIFSDLDRLRDINKGGRLQLIFAGKAHPRDEAGKRIIKEIYDYRSKLRGDINVVYLENYNMDLAGRLTSGVDVWLNTPLPPNEASGTSGMKAAFNGVINFSVLDGWWIEGCIEGVTGWAIGPKTHELIGDAERRIRELKDLYNKLEYLVIPMFYNNRDAWTNMMKNSIGKIAYYFHSHRMMRRYAAEAYL